MKDMLIKDTLLGNQNKPWESGLLEAKVDCTYCFRCKIDHWVLKAGGRRQMKTKMTQAVHSAFTAMFGPKPFFGLCGKKEVVTFWVFSSLVT